MFKWAASEELAPASVYGSLATVEGLKLGRAGARESSRVQPVEETTVNAILEHLPENAAAMVRLLSPSGMRPGEIIAGDPPRRAGAVGIPAGQPQYRASRDFPRGIHRTARASDPGSVARRHRPDCVRLLSGSANSRRCDRLPVRQRHVSPARSACLPTERNRAVEAEPASTPSRHTSPEAVWSGRCGRLYWVTRRLIRRKSTRRRM